MYSNPHAAVGLVLTTTTYVLTNSEELAFAIGIPLAIASHYFLDFLFEKHLSKKEVIEYDVIPSLIYVLLALFSGHFWLAMFSWWAGNLFDLIDKKLYLTIFFPKKFKATHYFHNHKNGIRFTLKQTKLASVVGTVIIIGMMFILKQM